jgi:hypothetical protein
VLPASAGFTHLTAAAAYGWWLPPLPQQLPVFVTMPADAARPRRGGLIVSRCVNLTPPHVIDGIRVAAAEETLLACARHLELLDLVVLCDAALHQGAVTPEALALAASARRRGAPALRRAVALADGRSESAWESVLRMLHVTCGVAVEPQHRVHDRHGSFVARGDLWLVGTKTLHEYDGAGHRAAGQHRKDLDRDRRLAGAAWTRRGYTSHEVLTQGIAILREADASVGRRHEAERIRPWHDLLAGSLLTPAGQSSVLRRWGLPTQALSA